MRSRQTQAEVHNMIKQIQKIITNGTCVIVDDSVGVVVGDSIVTVIDERSSSKTN